MDETLQLTSMTNNTFDLKALETSLNEIKHNSFNYLYGVQQDLSGYRRFNFKMGDLVLSNMINNQLHYYPRKYVVYINENFIAEKYRKSYKNSQYFNKELSLFDVAHNPDIFYHTFMVFIDGKLFDTINVLCKEDKTYFIFDINDGKNTTGIPKAYFDELKTKNADITIWFVPNCSYGVYDTNAYVLKKYINGLALSRFNLANNLESTEKYITFVNNNNFLFAGVMTDTTNSAEMLQFYDNSGQSFDSKYIHLNIFGFRHLLDQIDIVGTEKYFSIPAQDMPIPVENIMVFRNINGMKYFAHDISFKLYYPNIYEIVGNTNDDDLTLYIFYTKSVDTTTLKYKNELQLYYSFTTNVLDKYKDSTILDIIKNYQPPEFIYDISDYQKNQYHPDHLKYKCETFKSWFKQNKELLRPYLYNQIKNEPGYLLDMNSINLQSKYRENNFQEISDTNLQETFNEPRYVFIFRNEYNEDLYNLRLFIDGYLYYPDKVFKTKQYDYYYIPVSLINANSIVEIEKFIVAQFDKEVIITDISEEILVELPKLPTNISVNDIFLTLSDNSYLSKDVFTIKIPDGKGGFVDAPDDSFKEITTFKLVLNDVSLLNTSLHLWVKKIAYLAQDLIDEAAETISGMFFDINSIDDPRHFRIFRNGRLIPERVYDINFGQLMTDTISVSVHMLQNMGDTLTVDCTPYKYKTVYEQDIIDETGFIDLTGIIDKPFDLKWYDIYLNGLKLNKNNIDIISATKIIIKNVSTLKHLCIYQNNRDTDVFRYDSIEPTIIDQIWSNDEEFRLAVLNSHDIIIESMDDLITQIITDLGPSFLQFYEIYMKYRFINADLADGVNADISSRYPEIIASDAVFINPDNGGDEIVMPVFPS